MHYSTLYRLLTWCEKSLRVVTEKNRKDVIEFYMKPQVTQELLYKWFHDKYFMRAPLAVTYKEYTREAKRVGDRVLSKMSVYQCLRDDGRFKCRNNTPYKDCKCDTCLNNSLIVDALIVAGAKGVVRRISRNILKSYCPVNKKEATGESTCTRKLQFDDDNQVEEEVMTEHNHDCICCAPF